MKSGTGEVQMALGELLKEDGLIGWYCLQVFQTREKGCRCTTHSKPRSQRFAAVGGEREKRVSTAAQGCGRSAGKAP